MVPWTFNISSLQRASSDVLYTKEEVFSVNRKVWEITVKYPLFFICAAFCWSVFMHDSEFISCISCILLLPANHWGHPVFKWWTPFVWIKSLLRNEYCAYNEMFHSYSLQDQQPVLLNPPLYLPAVEQASQG